jgi:hypothetical protein
MAHVALHFENPEHANRKSSVSYARCDDESERAIAASLRQGGDVYREVIDQSLDAR